MIHSNDIYQSREDEIKKTEKVLRDDEILLKKMISA